MTTKSEIDLLIFDLDGTLIESKWDIADSVNLTLRELGSAGNGPQEKFSDCRRRREEAALRLAVGEDNQDRFRSSTPRLPVALS